MRTVIALALLCAPAFAAHVPKDVAPVGPAPYSLNCQQGPDGVIRVFGARQHRFASTSDSVGSEVSDLKGLTVYTAVGQEVSIKDAVKKLAAGAPAVASEDGKKVALDKRKALKAGTLIFVSPDLSRHLTPERIHGGIL